MQMDDYETLLLKPAANDVERPQPPVCERRSRPLQGDLRSQSDSPPSDGGDGTFLAA